MSPYYYTNLGRIIAGLGVALGLAGIAIGLAFASGDHDPSALLGTKTSGQWIDRGIYTFICSVVIGILTDISRSIARDATQNGAVEDRSPLRTSGNPGMPGITPTADKANERIEGNT